MLSKLRRFFVKPLCLSIFTWIFLSSLIVFISTFIQVVSLPGSNFAKLGNSFAKIFFGFPAFSSYLMPFYLLLAIVSISLIIFSNLFKKVNTSLKESLEALATMVASMGFLIIITVGILDTNMIYFAGHSNQDIKYVFLRTLEYSFFCAVYLCSLAVACRMLAINENDSE